MSSPFLLANHEPHVGSLFLADDGSAPVGYKTFVDGRGRWQEVGDGEPRTPSTLDTLQINHVESSKHLGARCLPPSPARSLLSINDTIPKKLTHSLHADLFAETGHTPTGGQAGSNASSLVGFRSLSSSRPHPPPSPFSSGCCRLCSPSPRPLFLLKRSPRSSSCPSGSVQELLADYGFPDVGSAKLAQSFIPAADSPTSTSANYIGTSNGSLPISPVVRGLGFDRFIQSEWPWLTARGAFDLGILIPFLPFSLFAQSGSRTPTLTSPTPTPSSRRLPSRVLP